MVGIQNRFYPSLSPKKPSKQADFAEHVLSALHRVVHPSGRRWLQRISVDRISPGLLSRKPFAQRHRSRYDGVLAFKPSAGVLGPRSKRRADQI